MIIDDNFTGIVMFALVGVISLTKSASLSAR